MTTRYDTALYNFYIEAHARYVQHAEADVREIISQRAFDALLSTLLQQYAAYEATTEYLMNTLGITYADLEQLLAMAQGQPDALAS